MMNDGWDGGDGGCDPDFGFCDDPCDLFYDCGGPAGPPANSNPGIAGPTIAPPVKDPYNGPLWTDHGGFHPTPYSDINAGLSDLLNLPTQGCEFGGCGNNFLGGLVGGMRQPGESVLHCVNAVEDNILGEGGRKVLHAISGVSLLTSLATVPVGSTTVGVRGAEGWNVIQKIGRASCRERV